MTQTDAPPTDCPHGLDPTTCNLCWAQARIQAKEEGRPPPEWTQTKALGTKAKPKVAVRGKGASRGKPMHPMLRWNPDQEQDTVDLHAKIAAEHGAVWWAKPTVGKERRPAAWRLKTLDDQLRRGTPTWAFLYRQGDGPEVARIWRARVLEVSEDGVGVDPALMPSSSSVEQSSLFVKLADITELAPGWALGNLGLFDTGEPLDAARLLGRATLMWVFEPAKGAGGA